MFSDSAILPENEFPLFQNSDNSPPTIAREPRKIHCHDCSQQSGLAGYAFRLVPICAPCREDEEIRVLHKRIDRRARK